MFNSESGSLESVVKCVEVDGVKVHFIAVTEQHVQQSLGMGLCLLRMQMLEAVHDSKSLRWGGGVGGWHVTSRLNLQFLCSFI